MVFSLVWKSSKIDFLSKKVKNYLKWEFQKNQVLMRLHVGKWYTFFELKLMWRFEILHIQPFFWYFKISWKIMDFWYQNLHSTKKSWWKNDFSQITHMWSDIDFMDFWKKSIFFEIFCLYRGQTFLFFLKNFVQKMRVWTKNFLFFFVRPLAVRKKQKGFLFKPSLFEKVF